MDKTRIIQRGEEVKFQVQIAGFDMESENFQVELIYGYRRTVVLIEKEQMLENAGTYYIVFDTADMIGRVVARCTWHMPDSDASGGEREKVDEQYLCFVADVPCPQFISCPACTEEHQVTYTRIEESGIADNYERLADKYDRPLLTADDEYIMVLKNNQE